MSDTPAPFQSWDDLTPEQLDWYLAGTIVPGETDRVRDLAARTPALDALAGVLKQARWITPHDFQHDLATGEAKRRIANRLGCFPTDVIFSAARTDEVPAAHVAPPSPRRAVRPVRSPWLVRTLAWGAAAAVCIAAWIVVPRWIGHTDALAARTFATATGERIRVTLPDGSRAMLAPRTQVRYVQDVRGARTITLSGQAYFTVRHDPAHPFTVVSGAVRTRVLGTAFQVRHYASDSSVEVVVDDGKVATQVGTRAAIVTRGTGVRVADSTIVPLRGDDPTRATEWTRGQLVFSETPVPTALDVLGRWYGYEFRLADSTLVRETITTTFSVHDPVTALRMLQTLLDVTATIDGQVVTLRPQRHAKPVRPVRRSVADRFSPSAEVGK